MNKLERVHPQLVASVTRILAAMQAMGYPMLVTDGVRTTEQQAALYRQGRTAPGRIVTNCDGIRLRSNHQSHADGWGHAVDCAFLVHGTPSWDDALPWALYGYLVRFEKLVWGGDWAGLLDRPHCELPEMPATKLA